MVKIGEKTVVSVTCQDVILQLAEQYCSEGEYLHFGMKENPKKYVLVTDEKIYLIKSEYCEQIEPPVRMIEPASAINRATQCNRESH